MSFYTERVLPHIMDKACDTKEIRPHRARACAGLRGDVVEIGFGSGLNIPFYPAAVTQVAAVEPAEKAWQLASDRLGAATVPIRWSGLDGQSLPFPDASFDAALSTMTMCTIPDVEAALAEVHRVLKPGGQLHFLEHGLAPDVKVQRWQHRIEPMQKRVFGGCHITRQIADLIGGAGFAITEMDTFYAKGAPKFAGAISLGVART
jgi:ubiquinone/menaquinone biosynthesis C-methylase UbiE